MNLESHPAITLRQIWHFVVAAETGTMSEAARRLHMAPSAISMSIAELERIIGAELCIKRKSKGLTLTSTGRAVFLQARELLDLADEIASLSKGDRPNVRGPLTVGCYMTLGPTIIPPMLSDFAAQCPHVDVDFVEGYHEDLQERLLDGSIDAAFLYDMNISPAVRTAPLLTADPYILLPASHPLQAAAEISLKDIAAEPLIFFDAPPISTRILEMYRESDITPHVLHRSRSYATVRSLVATGRGVAVLFQRPRLEAPYEELRVALKPLAQPRSAIRQQATVCLAWPRSTRLNARAQAWVDVATERFSANPPDVV
ncbi:LysR family transcriptional regulator [Arthrobacter sp. I2-34]|uniref:LysR family transcriptional regulator n=1 Tax=Arthrobacter hankyongi TaxID=2904801 RepID=A0ABS9L421_9MICC|nr:LysR family transcriptional regulator [Arthrobacter hankyongi]MCG2621424.1 LysR family transcriptional regulator [Arthrobacter hankyongi]